LSPNLPIIKNPTISIISSLFLACVSVLMAKNANGNSKNKGFHSYCHSSANFWMTKRKHHMNCVEMRGREGKKGIDREE
jgi:hypothetical protein